MLVWDELFCYKVTAESVCMHDRCLSLYLMVR